MEGGLFINKFRKNIQPIFHTLPEVASMKNHINDIAMDKYLTLVHDCPF